MLTASRAATWQERRGLLAALVVAAIFAAYAWPLVDGATSESFAGADGLLRLAAVTAVGQACLSASWRHEGRDRFAMRLLAAGAQLWAVVQAIHLARYVLGQTAGPAALDDLGTLALSGSSAAALWLLGEPVGRRAALRLAVEWSLLAVSTFLLLRLVLPPFWSAGDDLADGTRALGISVLVAASLLSLGRAGVARAWPLLPESLVLVAGGLVAAALPVTSLGPRAPGVMLTAGLALVALTVTLGQRPPLPAAPDGGVPQPAGQSPVLWILPLAAVAAALPGLLGADRLDPLDVVGVIAVGLLAVAHGHLASVEAHSRARDLWQAESRMRHRAFHDELTGLPNRALFLDRLTHALDLHRRHRTPLSVLYSDLDGFKQVNDQHGHAAGDALLAAVASRLRDCLRPEDTLARLGGDEFALLLEHDSSPDVVAGRMRQVLQEPFRIAGGELDLRMSIGTARVSAESPTPTPQEVLDQADADMYAGKRPGRARRGAAGLLHPSASPLPPMSEADLAAALARALHTGEVHVVYQPLVDASTGAVHGMEALARWTHDGRVLLPAAFVELAERFGLSGTLTDVVLEQSCAQLRRWSTASGHDRLTMAVNVTPSQLGDPTLAQRVRGAVQRHGLQEHQVVVETTVAALTAAKPAGGSGGDPLRLSVTGFHGHPDDFALLTALPVRSVKMPRQRADHPQPDDDRLLQVLVALGREIDVHVVVERVERKEELAPLRQLPGVLAQGNLLSRPAEARTLDQMVLRGCSLPV